MFVWFAAVLAFVFFGGGIFSAYMIKKTNMTKWKIATGLLFLFTLACIGYLAAAVLLVGAIK